MLDYTKPLVIRGINNGYEYFIDYSHPLATGNSGRVYLHRHLASIYLNRWLRSEEQVHHIDENKLNNIFSNYLICSASEHASIHQGTISTVICPVCTKAFKGTSRFQIYCSKTCSGVPQIRNPLVTKEILDKLIPCTSWTALAKMFGYSDTGIKKRAKKLGCIPL